MTMKTFEQGTGSRFAVLRLVKLIFYLIAASTGALADFTAF
ncbi:MAG: hypothetical protein ACR2K5_09915 [Pseudolabrys sp.]